MKHFFDYLVAMVQFGLASIELYRGLSGNSSNPALALVVSMFCFGMGIKGHGTAPTAALRWVEEETMKVEQISR